MTKPTKVIAGLGAIAFIGGGLWFLYTGRSEIEFKRVTPAEASKAVAVLSLDRDNDGLKDWEEQLWHTDPLKPDTDGDGTSDGEEIKLGRDPTKAGPDDKLDKGTIEQKTVPGGGDWTETDRLSREFFAKYLSMRQSGQPFTADDEKNLLEEFVNRYPQKEAGKTYTESDIVLSKNDDDAALRAYGNGVGTVLNAHTDTGESELVIFERALENEDATDLANLKSKIKRYEALLGDLQAIPTPKSAEAAHLALLNSIEAIRESVAGMALAMTDPVHTLSAAASYPKAVEKLAAAFNDISSLLSARKIVFGKNEAGRILTE